MTIVNNITGDRLVTDIPSEKYKANWDVIWGKKEMTQQVNQCDGCRSGWEFHALYAGLHLDPVGRNHVMCTKGRYD